MESSLDLATDAPLGASDSPIALSVWALLALIAYGVAVVLGVFDANAEQPDLLDVEGNVAAYLKENPSVADRMPARPESEPVALGFSTEAGRNVQLGMTAMMILDTAQTYTIAASPDCLREANPIAAAVFGSEHPSPQRVLLTNTLYMAAHWALGAYLDRKAQRSDDWAFARRLYQVLTIAGHGWAVVNNERKGIRPFSTYECEGVR